MSRLDVIVPSYNYAHYLRQCVESVLSQSHGDLRVLIIDDASPDHTEEVARELVAEDPRVQYRRHAVNQGHIATHNEGLDWATGEYTLVISADDLLARGALARAVGLLDDHPDVGFVHGAQIVFRDSPLISAFSEEGDEAGWQISDGKEFIEHCCATGSNPVATPTVVVRTRLMKQTGGYRSDLPHTADMERWFRLALHASVGKHLAVQAYKRMHDKNMQYQYCERTIGDLQQRLAAFEVLFREHADELSDPDRMHRLSCCSLGMEGFWAASESFDRGDLTAYQRLLDFALVTYPELRSRPEWTRFSIKRWLGPRVWRVLHPLASLVRGRSPIRFSVSAA
jgi:glycosyltransferase involved in cell wall biosynthesis